MKNQKKTISAFILALILAALLPAGVLTASASSGNAGVQKSCNGVVRVVKLMEADYYTVDENDQLAYYTTLSSWGSGSAFGVGTAGKETDVFVTNRHVVEDSEPEIVTTQSGQRYYVEYRTTGYYVLLDNYAYNTESNTIDTSRAIPCTVIYIGSSEDEDLAILKTAEPVPGRIALRLLDDEDSLQQMDTVSSIGYPGSSDKATSEGFMLASVDDVTVNIGNISRFYDSASVTGGSSGSLTGHLIQHSAAINGGNSGGPLVDGNGVVVGINTYTYHGGSQAVSNSYYALRIKYAKDALDGLGIHYDVYKAGPSPVVIVIVVVVLVAAAGGAAAFLFLKKGKAPAFAAAAKPAAVPASAPVPPAQPAAGDSGLRIQGQSGSFAGRRFAISGSLRIGRDPASNDLVYPANAPGISGRHCVVLFEGGKLWLKDLGSTHGTFLANGQRLAANQAVPIAVGDRFWLGSEQETFVIAQKGGM